MKYVVISDVHGNLQALEAVKASLPELAGMEVICAGDTVGYGADPGDCVDSVAALASWNVMGNHDAAVTDKISAWNFNERAARAVEWAKGRIGRKHRAYLEALPQVFADANIEVVHGTLHSPEEFRYMRSRTDAAETFDIMRTQVCFVGHTHVPGVFTLGKGEISYASPNRVKIEKDEKYVVNAGSVGQPRDGDSRACYCIYDTETAEISFRRVKYDVEAARGRILEEGLPEQLGDRLLRGR